MTATLAKVDCLLNTLRQRILTHYRAHDVALHAALSGRIRSVVMTKTYHRQARISNTVFQSVNDMLVKIAAPRRMSATIVGITNDY